MRSRSSSGPIRVPSASGTRSRRSRTSSRFPNLIELQKASFEWFKTDGLAEAFDSISPDQGLHRQPDPGVRRALARRAEVFDRGVPRARHDLQRAAARARPLDHRRVGRDQGHSRPRDLHGRFPAHDRQGHVHDQRRRARDREPARPLAGRLLTARTSTRTRVRRSTRRSFPTAARGSSSRPTTARRTTRPRARSAFASTRTARSTSRRSSARSRARISASTGKPTKRSSSSSTTSPLIRNSHRERQGRQDARGRAQGNLQEAASRRARERGERREAARVAVLRREALRSRRRRPLQAQRQVPLPHREPRPDERVERPTSSSTSTPTPARDAADDARCLTRADMIAVIRRLIKVATGVVPKDDIDHLGNRRVRSVGELLQNQFRVGLLRLERVVRERMTVQDIETVTPQALINIRPVVAAIKEFFGSSQLSQFMDQTNSLAELTHKRRLSALGPGRSLARARRLRSPRRSPLALRPHLPDRDAGRPEHRSDRFARDLRARQPLRLHRDAVPRRDATASLPTRSSTSPPIAKTSTSSRRPTRRSIPRRARSCRSRSSAATPRSTSKSRAARVQLMDVSPKQIVSVATALIPFLEHDDANRALMGANMQRQAVPLLRPRCADRRHRHGVSCRQGLGQSRRCRRRPAR